MNKVKLGIVGHPLDHSLSPMLHNWMLKWSGLEGSYQCFPICPTLESKFGLADLFLKLKRGQLQGLNVTIPYKCHILSLLDGYSSAAKQIGAVNTIFVKDNRLLGENTDIEGFQNDLVLLGFSTPGINNEALILGAGGAARAVAFVLQKLGWRLVIASRRIEQAQALISSLEPHLCDVTISPLAVEAFRKSYGLIVNATPLGMPPHDSSSPWPENVPFPENAAVYDLVYHQQTPLISAALASGNPASNGLGMLIEQAAISFEIWTGKVIPRQELRLALVEALVTKMIKK